MAKIYKKFARRNYVIILFPPFGAKFEQSLNVPRFVRIRCLAEIKIFTYTTIITSKGRKKDPDAENMTKALSVVSSQWSFSFWDVQSFHPNIGGTEIITLTNHT